MSNFDSDTLGFDTGQIPAWSSDFYDADGNRTKFAPSVEIEQTGLKSGSPMARLWVNHHLFLIFQYLKWMSGEYVAETSSGEVTTQVENFEPLGTVKMINTSRGFTISDASTYWGGTWVSTTDTVGGVSVNVFEKTALAVQP